MFGLALFTRNLNAFFLTQIYEDNLLCSAQEMFPEGPDHWVLQEDNDPKRTSKKAKKMEEGKQRRQDDVARSVTRPEPHRKCVGSYENQRGKEKMPRSEGFVQGHTMVEEVEN